MMTFPNAKINLGLLITNRRADGYHDLLTVFCPVGWHDILEIVPSAVGHDTLEVGGNGCDCPPEKNLVMKAVGALRREFPDMPFVEIFLEKFIPDGAGLGGGSADAAFTLRSLNSLFSLGLSDDRLAEIAATIGADCPFFIYNHTMIGTGTGTTLSPTTVNFPEGGSIAIVKPPVGVSTREAYAGVNPRPAAVDLADIIARRPVGEWKDLVVNDFEESVFAAHPRLSEIKRRLYESGALYASMSGSGSALFGIFGKGDVPDIELEFEDCDCKIVPADIANSLSK